MACLDLWKGRSKAFQARKALLSKDSEQGLWISHRAVKSCGKELTRDYLKYAFAWTCCRPSESVSEMGLRLWHLKASSMSLMCERDTLDCPRTVRSCGRCVRKSGFEERGFWWNSILGQEFWTWASAYERAFTLWCFFCFANQFLWQVNLVQIQNEGRKWEVWKAREMDDTKFQEKGLCSQVGEQKRVDESRNAVQEEWMEHSGMKRWGPVF